MPQSGIIIGANQGLAKVMQRVEIVANKDLPVLIHGESGTGKEVVALAIHQRSHRQKMPFRRVNCGAIPPELIDSELFGHEHGAFTGSTARHKGWFEQADGGTLLLDEVGELPLNAQVRLLRVIQEGEFTRVGGERPLKVNVRIIAATHRDLPAMIEERQFREDLYYRLTVFPIVIPPLRDRQDDIQSLAEYFVSRATTRFGYKSIDVTPEQIELLKRYDWPGNIREFAAVIDRAVLLGDGNCLKLEKALGISLSKHTVSRIPAVIDATPGKNGDDILPLDAVIKAHIEKALTLCCGRVEGPFGAAKKLALNPNTLRSKAKKLAIEIEKFRG
ncbi:MAG: sigma-54-dependent Fis family transcriptional regulator [Deltaproteobacteria bacterium]|nr:sigma-54-dependent Fis family transcriptional regulator [Deltaproteobacteria bacterium]